jgi:signal transduction histidine kinase
MALNVAASAAAAGEIETTRQEISHLSNALYGAWSIFAIFAAVVAVRLARRYAIATEQQIAELELFAGRLAHDVRNPLSSVALAVTLSQERASDEKSREVLGRARRTLVRIGELMDGLLLLAKAVRTSEAGGPASVREVLLDVVENFRPLAAENAIDLDLGAMARCSVACSPGILTNMIGNLLDNSIKYMGDSAVRSVVVSAMDSGGTVRIEVEDTGPGIPAAAHTHVFELHARAAPTEVHGLGLGLATVKKLAEALRGTAGVRANRDCGSIFWIELPKMQASDGKTLGI